MIAPGEAPARIVMYTDGSSLGNPGPGGFGVLLLFGEYRREISAGYRLTTNNRMELLAVITGLEALKKPGSEVIIYTDSRYVVDTVEKGWLENWMKIRFKGKKNKDLWLRFQEARRPHKIKFVWVKGHAEIPGNERCDQLAVAAAKGDLLLADEGFEQDLAALDQGI
ncbi:MAG: ribonuclease HI [Marinilabiliales bacterium]|nr:ribonuclease HI [Marinilabiliales bacterium]